MHTRPALPTDLPSINTICVSVFQHDELYDFTNPHKSRYPDHFRHLFARRNHARYWTPGWVFQVAVTDAGDEGHDEDGDTVVGFALWCRVGTSAAAMRWARQGQWWAWLERTLAALTDTYTYYTHADKSTSHAHLRSWLAASHDEFAAIPELWKLQNLCVDPRCQRRGIGARLMEWGKAQAVREGCPVGLSSSMKGKGLYEKQGFRRYATIRVEGFPVEDVPVFLWEPPGMEGRWGSRGETTMEG